tara:strand:- start:3566 stop:3829 length:264 start_codon:yes stop_codon:yes gene_type:complete
MKIKEVKYILATDYDEEGFDADGAGDYFYTATNYREHETKEEILTSLQKNICYDDYGRYKHKKKKPNFSSIEEYCKEFGFRLYKREV